jgi:hypothetical protein
MGTNTMVQVKRPNVKKLHVVIGNKGLDVPLRRRVIHPSHPRLKLCPPLIKIALLNTGKRFVSQGVFRRNKVYNNIYCMDDPAAKRAFFSRGVSKRVEYIFPKRGSERLYEFEDVRLWQYKFLLTYDEDVFTGEEVVNLLSHAGVSEGVGHQRIGRGFENGAFRVLECKVEGV